jgi:protein TonB
VNLRGVLALQALSLAVHGAIAAAVFSLPKDHKREATAISMRETKKKPPERTKVDEPPPPPKETKPETTRKSAAKSEAKPQAKAAPQSAAPVSAGGGDAPDFGLSMSGSSGGLAIPVGGTNTQEPTPSADAPKRAAQAQAPKHEDCDEPLVKAKARAMVQPAYTDKAREAKVEGKVRIEVTLDEAGNVTSARVVAGLGYGLDESALSAAKRMTFSPATKCGKASGSTFVVAMRFVLGT